MIFGYARLVSPWIRTVSRTTLAAVTPELLYQGIESRLAAMAARYCPDDEESPQQVLARLKIERIEPDNKEPFGAWQLHYASSGRPVRVERMVGKGWEIDRRALFDEVGKGDDEVGKRLRALLTDAKESVGFELSPSDLRGMGLPVCIAAAAALAKAGDGLLRVEGDGWLEPKGKDVEPVMSFR